MAAQKPHFDKRTPKFVVEIQAMIDYNPSKAIRSIVRDIVVSECFEVHEDIQHFSNKMRKGQFLSQAMKDKRKEHTAKLKKKKKKASNIRKHIQQ